MTQPAHLDAVLAAVEQRVPYLRAARCMPTDADIDWLRCETIATNPAAIDAAIDAGAAARNTDDRVVAASLFVQSYAFKVAAPALAAYAIGLPTLPVRATDLAVRIANGRAAGLAYRSDSLAPLDDAAGLANELLAGHLDAFLAAVRARIRVGQRLLWGNVAASCAAAFRAVEGAARDRGDLAERAAVRARAARFFAAAAERFDDPGRFEIVTLDDADGWFWTRTSCCLWFRVADGGATCDDCSLIPVNTLAANRRAELAGTTA